MRRPTAVFGRPITDFASTAPLWLCGIAVVGLIWALSASAELSAQQPNAEKAPSAPDNNAVPPPQDAAPVEDAAEPPPELPPGFKPPGKLPQDMQFEKPLMTDEEEEALKKELLQAAYKNVLFNGDLNPAGVQDLLKKVAKYDVYRLSMRKYRRNLHEIRDALMSDVRNAATLLKAGPQADSFRTYFLQEVVNRAEELLDGNFYVRLQAALVLSHLNLREYAQGAPEGPFAPALKPLVAIVDSDEQRQAVKIVAVRGIQRMSLAGIPTETERVDIATRIISELKNPKSHAWYQCRLIEALATIDLAVDRENRAFIIQILTEIVADDGRHWLVRTEAAKGIGRAKISATINLKKVIYEVVKLGRDMIDAYNQKPNAYYWRNCFFNLYLTFQPRDPDEKTRQAGLKTRDFGDYNALLDSAYQEIHPLAAHVLNASSALPEPIPHARIDGAEDWLKKNVPENQTVGPGLPPISRLQAKDETRPQR